MYKLFDLHPIFAEVFVRTRYTTALTIQVMRQCTHRCWDLFSTFDIVSCSSNASNQHSFACKSRMQSPLLMQAYSSTCLLKLAETQDLGNRKQAGLKAHGRKSLPGPCCWGCMRAGASQGHISSHSGPMWD